MFDNVSSTETEKTELVLLDLVIGLGFRQFSSGRQYLFYELSTARYDGRPPRENVFCGKCTVRAGAGLNFCITQFLFCDGQPQVFASIPILARGV